MLRPNPRFLYWQRITGLSEVTVILIKLWVLFVKTHPVVQ